MNFRDRRLLAIPAALGAVGLIYFNRLFFCKRSWHVLHSMGNSRGFYFYCPLCGFSIEGGRHVGGPTDNT